MAKKRAKRRTRKKTTRKSETDMAKLGHYAFFAGAILAIIAGIFTNILNPQALVSILAVLGLVVGLLNITQRETTGFLLASVALLLSGIINWGPLVPVVGTYLSAMLFNMAVFVVPAAVIVALRTIYVLAEKR